MIGTASIVDLVAEDGDRLAQPQIAEGRPLQQRPAGTIGSEAAPFARLGAASLASGQTVRHLTLDQGIEGSNPSSPANPCPRERMMKPRIFLGSSTQQEKLLQALTRGLEDIADVEPWTTVFNPGVSTLDRLVELTHEVDFAAFIFGLDDWMSKGVVPDPASGQAAPTRQCRVRGRAVRRRAWHASDVHPARPRREAADRSAGPDIDPL